jgi:hypothetical protein
MKGRGLLWRTGILRVDESAICSCFRSGSTGSFTAGRRGWSVDLGCGACCCVPVLLWRRRGPRGGLGLASRLSPWLRLGSRPLPRWLRCTWWWLRLRTPWPSPRWTPTSFQISSLRSSSTGGCNSCSCGRSFCRNRNRVIRNILSVRSWCWAGQRGRRNSIDRSKVNWLSCWGTCCKSSEASEKKSLTHIEWWWEWMKEGWRQNPEGKRWTWVWYISLRKAHLRGICKMFLNRRWSLRRSNERGPQFERTSIYFSTSRI